MAKTGTFGIAPLTGSGGSGATIVTTASQTPSVIDISNASGNTLATWKSFTFVVFIGSIDIDGESFKAGTYGFENIGGLGVISYDASASGDAKIMVQS